MLIPRKWKNSKFFYKKTFRSRMICLHRYFSSQMQHMLENIDDYLDGSQGPFFKNNFNDTTTVGVISLSEHVFVVKRYNFKSFWHALKLRVRPSRAMRSWIYAHLLQDININTIRPIAIVENRIGLFRGKAYFVSEYIKGVRGCDYFADDSTLKKYWPVAIKEIENLTLLLRDNYFCHSDFHFGNLLLVNHKPVLLDLDSMRKYNRNSIIFRHNHNRDLKIFRKYLSRNKAAAIAFKQYQTKNIF